MRFRDKLVHRMLFSKRSTHMVLFLTTNPHHIYSKLKQDLTSHRFLWVKHIHSTQLSLPIPRSTCESTFHTCKLNKVPLSDKNMYPASCVFHSKRSFCIFHRLKEIRIRGFSRDFTYHGCKEMWPREWQSFQEGCSKSLRSATNAANTEKQRADHTFWRLR